MSALLKSTSIGAITLFTEDLDRSKSFYQDVFGLPVHFEDEDSAVFKLDNTLINLLKIPAACDLIGQPGWRRCGGGKSIASAGYTHYCAQAGNRGDRSLAEDGMDKAVTDRMEQQVRSAFPEGAIARVQVLQYGDDPEVEPGQAAMRVFFDWPGRRAEGKKADPKTVHAFVTANAAALGILREELPRVIRWVEFRPEDQAGAASPHGLSYRITDRGRSGARDEAPEDLTPVMVRLGSADLATLDSLITAGIVNSRAEGLRWALSRIREPPGLHPAR